MGITNLSCVSLKRQAHICTPFRWAQQPICVVSSCLSHAMSRRPASYASRSLSVEEGLVDVRIGVPMPRMPHDHPCNFYGLMAAQQGCLEFVRPDMGRTLLPFAKASAIRIPRPSNAWTAEHRFVQIARLCLLSMHSPLKVRLHRFLHMSALAIERSRPGAPTGS